ncbi:helix-turn-helix domain-containing protein [Weissella cibaria]|uniref:helix-turn-helix domain-containing protein n=1 Tax=Weissella cibaria TaxID=137591 RepID=UPI00223AB075|nr:helix-turn-helix transcriptional regulator [Weissella cibaria]MCT0020980.1 XRE family transcriptional regulator [Weissella cibaria]
MSQVLLAERINALRDEKNITVEDIERAGISRSRYYRFVRGETQISVVDLSRLLKLLAVSFSELFAGVIADPYQLSIGDLAKCRGLNYVKNRRKLHKLLHRLVIQRLKWWQL